MKLLQLTAIDLTVYRFLVPLMRRMREEGWEVGFACAEGEKARAVEKMGFRFHPIRTTRRLNPPELAIEFLDMFRLFKRERPDAVHLHTPIASFLGRFAAKAAGVPAIIYTAHGFYHHEGMPRLKRAFFEALERLAGRSATDLIFSQGFEDFKWAISNIRLPRNRIIHIGNGIDLSWFSRASVDQERARRLRGEIGEGRIVLSCGRAVREKGFFELVEASAKVIKEHPDAVFVLAGQGPDLEKLKELARKIRVSENWRFLGWREEMRELLAISYVFVLPSWREGMPRSIIEAMAMERPVIATNIRGCREEVIHGETGILVPPRDPESLGAAIITLLRDEPLATKMGEAGRARAEELFGEEGVIEKQIEAIRVLLNARSPAGRAGS
jgi:glycosyltransferase involved in cell wall biosynthesis